MPGDQTIRPSLRSVNNSNDMILKQIHIEQECWLEPALHDFSYDGTYTVSVLAVFDTKRPGMFRSQGAYLDDSGKLSFVANGYAFGSVSCGNSTTQTLTIIYSCPLFGDCSLLRGNSDFLYVLSDQLDIPCDCMDQVVALCYQAGFDVGEIAYLPHLLDLKCVTSFNGVPVINADRVPASGRMDYPIRPQSATAPTD